ncbi:MAG: cystathionine beta-synthase [Flavobacteriaceae bacterium]|nr:cystathionine beta-synthase [Flavobacteriaceae bacterium]
MTETNMLTYIDNVLRHMPQSWLQLTTHRLDIYDENLAKTQFLEQFEELYHQQNSEKAALADLPTAYDYIRLGHPLSCILEWAMGRLHSLPAENVISFSSYPMPILAILRKNSLDQTPTRIFYTAEVPPILEGDLLQRVYGYDFVLLKVQNLAEISEGEGSSVFISKSDTITQSELHPAVDFYVTAYSNLGSILMVQHEKNHNYISEIQHVRRRETIAMTPANSLEALQSLANQSAITSHIHNLENNRKEVVANIHDVTGTNSKAVVGSSGLSVQYAIMMGLVHHAIENHQGKAIKFIVPPNCYGGTNDQARRVAAAVGNVEVVDLPVDGNNDMVRSIDKVLAEVAKDDAVPYIIAEIPTNPRVEVPDLQELKRVLEKERTTASDTAAIDPVFILDQTFCPNVQFLGNGEVLSNVRALSYVSGSKFPSGGRSTAGYCVGNTKAQGLMDKIALHLNLCENEATPLQYDILAQQLPSMNQRIEAAYQNTRSFVTFIEQKLPEAKINFVSEELAKQGFKPSVFSLDLPTKGATPEKREAYKRALNHTLIDLMITEIPQESKYCVSYGQLKGCYWTIPATSTQGTTKEGDKDYIARVALSPKMDLEKHKEVFSQFVEMID